jgi:hypothetical protein
MPLSRDWTAGFQLITGMNDVTARNGGRMGALTTAWTKPKWAWNQVWITGSEKISGEPAYRNLVDEVLVFTPHHAIHGYAELIYGQENRTGMSDHWVGTAASIKWNATDKLSFSPRVEYFADPSGFTSGTAQQLHEITVTADYKIARWLTSRYEFRRDASDHLVFGDAKTGMSRTQETFLAGLIWSWKGEK